MSDLSSFPASAIESPEAALFYWPIASVFITNTLLWIFCQTPWGKRDNSWIDCMWGPLFVIANAVVWIIRAVSEKNYGITTRMYFVSIPVFLWGMRLGIYIFIRKRSEDYRYKQWREGWEQSGSCNYYLQSYFKVFFLQGLISLVNNSAVLYVNIYSKDNGPIFPTDIIGLLIWFTGFMIEVFADRQLANHLANPRPGTGKFIKSGLWRYSRHPNYFGEAVMWWGLWIIACGVGYGWATFYSCLLMNLTLRYVSTPLPEEKYASNPEWQQYCKETNIFCLWFAKVKVEEAEKEDNHFKNAEGV